MSRPPIDTRAYLIQALEGFLKDPPDTRFQVGYLSALLDVWKNGLGFDVNNELFIKADYLSANIQLEEGESD